MLKMLCLPVMAIFAALSPLCAEDVLLKTGAELGTWSPATLKYDKSVKNEVCTLKIVADESEKPGLYNLQCFMPYPESLKADSKYKVEFTIKSSMPLEGIASISQNKTPWGTYAAMKFKLAANEAKSLTLVWSPTGENCNGPFRIPLLALGLAPAGCVIEISNIKFSETN